MKKLPFLPVNILLVGMFLTATMALGAMPPNILDATHANVRAAMAVQEGVTPLFMKKEGIIGTAVGLDAADQVVVLVYVNKENPSAALISAALPKAKSGIKIMPVMTGPFRALARPSLSLVSHKAPQTPPIELGTSGGWQKDLANGYCCGGTLGALVQVNQTQFVLSNYHVFESDIVPGGNGIVATTGDPVGQPGLIDVACSMVAGETVGTLVTLHALPSSNVDASVAQVEPGMVREDGSILEIGPISSQTAPAALKQKVKKSGRTTGLTFSSVSGLNATVSVAYDDECAGASAFTKTFQNQIIISNRGSKFLNSGDSGSLLVQDIPFRPKSIGLLFAGSQSLAVANPIDEVLTLVGNRLGGAATMVGN